MALLLGHDDVRRSDWGGPSLGLDFGTGPLLPRHGPFPVTYPRSPLGAFHMRLGLVHWFGPDRDVPSFGLTLQLSMLVGQ